jgi:hypothetical protein
MANQATIQPNTTEQDDESEEDLDERVCVYALRSGCNRNIDTERSNKEKRP